MTSGDGGSEEQENGTGGGGGSVHIGSMSGGAIATGRHGKATSTSYTGNGPQTDEATLALLAAVRDLRADMGVLAASDETRAVGGELDEVEGEITRTGRADATRLARLRERLEPGATAIGLLASAATVVQAVGQVLG